MPRRYGGAKVVEVVGGIDPVLALGKGNCIKDWRILEERREFQFRWGGATSCDGQLDSAKARELAVNLREYLEESFEINVDCKQRGPPEGRGCTGDVLSSLTVSQRDVERTSLRALDLQLYPGEQFRRWVQVDFNSVPERRTVDDRVAKRGTHATQPTNTVLVHRAHPNPPQYLLHEFDWQAVENVRRRTGERRHLQVFRAISGLFV